MNLCIVTSSYPANPSDVSAPFFAELAHELQALGHTVVVVAPDRPGVEKVPDGVDVMWIPWRGTGKPLVQTSLLSPVELWRVLGLLRAGRELLTRMTRERSIDVVVAMWALPAGFIAWRAQRQTRVRYAVWALGSDINAYARYPLVGMVVKRVLRGAEWRFADGIELAERASKLAGVPCEFVPTARALPAPKERLELPGRIRFLYVGRFEAVKGVDVLVQAMRRFRSDPGVHLYMRGSGSLDGEIGRTVKEAGLGDSVTLLPAASAEQVAAYMAACHCLVIPSRSESIPVVFSEALHAGIPVLMTEVGDMGRIARENDLAPPVAPGDPDALADAMSAFIADAAGQRRRYEAARARLLEVFDTRAVAERLVATFGARNTAGVRP